MSDERKKFLQGMVTDCNSEAPTGPMLVAKHPDFEKRFDVLEDQRLLGNKWLTSFYHAYKIQSI